MLELRARWGDDPVHLIPVGYTVLAESLIMSGNSETESKNESAKCRQETRPRGERDSAGATGLPAGGDHATKRPPPTTTTHNTTTATSSNPMGRYRSNFRQGGAPASAYSRPGKRPRWCPLGKIELVRNRTVVCFISS